MRSISRVLLAGTLFLVGCGASDDATVTHFPAMHQPRAGHTQTPLADGRVLLAGGLHHLKSVLPPANHVLEIFDPATLTFTAVGRMTTVRILHTATRLTDGRVVFIGGSPGTTVDVFDPATGRISTVGEILEPRMGHTATLLADGRILIVGGMHQTASYKDGKLDAGYKYLRSIEVYDPGSGLSVSFPAALRGMRRGHTATRLADGRVMILGGSWERRAEMIDTVRGVKEWGPSLHVPREDHRTTRLADGRLLLTGGTDMDGRSIAVAEIYDPKTRRFRRLEAPMIRKREDHTATLLPDGRVLIVGGEDNAGGKDRKDLVLDDVEIFETKTETFVKLDPLRVPRDEHHASALPDGSVLVTGGAGNDERARDSAEIILPP